MVEQRLCPLRSGCPVQGNESAFERFIGIGAAQQTDSKPRDL